MKTNKRIKLKFLRRHLYTLRRHFYSFSLDPLRCDDDDCLLLSMKLSVTGCIIFGISTTVARSCMLDKCFVHTMSDSDFQYINLVILNVVRFWHVSYTFIVYHFNNFPIRTIFIDGPGLRESSVP